LFNFRYLSLSKINIGHNVGRLLKNIIYLQTNFSKCGIVKHIILCLFIQQFNCLGIFNLNDNYINLHWSWRSTYGTFCLVSNGKITDKALNTPFEKEGIGNMRQFKTSFGCVAMWSLHSDGGKA